MDPLAEYRRRSRIAADSVVSIASAVRPLFAVTGHYPDPVASCVLLNLRDQYFLLSAAHAVDPYKTSGLVVGCGNELHPLNGQVFNSARGKSGGHGDDPTDAAVVHLTPPVPLEMRSSCLSWEDLDLEPLEEERFFYVVCGFRLKTSHVDATTARSRMDRYNTIEWKEDVYRTWDFSREKHVVLGYDKMTEVDQETRTTPLPRGMSGGAVFKIHGLSADPYRQVAADLLARPKLAAIFIEARDAVQGKQPVMVGTRTWVHMKLIRDFFPQVFEP